MSLVWILLAALLLDRLIGEPRRWHPLVGFGQLAQRIERRCNFKTHRHRRLKLSGSLSLALLVFPLTILTAIIASRYNHYYIFEIFILYLALGARSLVEHGQRVRTALLAKNTTQARLFTSHLVSRDTDTMTETEMSRAVIESTLENGNDAIFAPLFWFIIAGAPGVVFYRLCNTLDAMWGYRTTRFLHFGWAAARLDDVLNYIPARLTALTYACLGRFRTAIHCWRTQASLCKSPNGGPVMSAGAGTLALQLGGPSFYHGKLEACPLLGCGKAPQADNINQAIQLIQKGIALWLVLATLIVGGLHLA